MKKLHDYFGKINELEKIAEQNIENLKRGIEKSKKDLKYWEDMLALAQLLDAMAGSTHYAEKKGQLRYKWTQLNLQGSKVWTSEVGNVNLKAWGKYEGFPKCLEHLKPFADGDHSSNHMAHRPKKDYLDTDTADFDTLIDCQLAVEKAHEDWLNREKRGKGKTKVRSCDVD